MMVLQLMKQDEERVRKYQCYFLKIGRQITKLMKGMLDGYSLWYIVQDTHYEITSFESFLRKYRDGHVENKKVT